MAGFSEGAFMKKLTELNSSSQSIQTLSLWLIHHRKHHGIVVKNWFKELLKAKDSRKLTLMYLANDVIQNSKKKGPEYNKEFGGVLKKAFEHMSSTDEKIKASLGRLIHIWKEREMYDELTIAEYKQALLLPNMGDPPAKKIKTENSKKEKHQHKSPNREHNKSEADIRIVDGTLETHVHLSPRTPAGDPPEPDELIKAIQDLESSIASTDEATRERISNFPKEVSDISVLPTIEDKLCAEKLKVQVDEAISVVNEYNSRLSVEIESRKKITNMLKDFLPSQKELLAQAERTLEEYQDKLQKIYGVRQELKSHIQNLPDLTQLPDVTGGLAPLPSAGDLFNLH
ncbi:regulation of nuclear pre-mRNA domain-containing protein 1B isoform X2 [Onthophagus taurus]|uniref:regulation of nuclear pre-mRNA domain-containing protein 1B isoform X2 n=1 Tax=Onthophagus taurus TaxID=166361 RepID=UPI000C20AA94|nr:regulation of nuclear pre-mRNA domain-containing protein 1B isoform X2 [Onthophagus taurus]